MKTNIKTNTRTPVNPISVTIISTVLIVSTLGCAAPTKYQSKSTGPGDLTWSYGRSIAIQKDGATVAKAKKSWKGLPEAVDCVPKAKAYAQKSVKHARAGKAKDIAGVIVTLSSIAAGMAMVFSNITSDDYTMIYAGLGTMAGGSLGIGIPLTLSGSRSTKRSYASAVDALYFYNDHHQGIPVCGTAPAKPAESATAPTGAPVDEPVITTTPTAKSPALESNTNDATTQDTSPAPESSTEPLEDSAAVENTAVTKTEQESASDSNIVPSGE